MVQLETAPVLDIPAATAEAPALQAKQTVVERVWRQAADFTEWAMRPTGLEKHEWKRIQDVQKRMALDWNEQHPQALPMDRWNAHQDAYLDALAVVCPEKAEDPSVQAALLNIPSL